MVGGAASGAHPGRGRAAENDGTVAFDVEVTKTDGTVVAVQVAKDLTVSAPEAAESH